MAYSVDMKIDVTVNLLNNSNLLYHCVLYDFITRK